MGPSVNNLVPAFILICFDIKLGTHPADLPNLHDRKYCHTNAFQILKLVLIDKARPVTKSKPDDSISLYSVISQSVTDLTGHFYNPVRNI